MAIGSGILPNTSHPTALNSGSWGARQLPRSCSPVRVKLMSLLLTSPDAQENSGELAAAVGLSESTVSHHLSHLRKAGLVASERRGMNVVHRARRDALSALCLVLDPNCCS
ncbi:metalloregulator ArsR/SmtB family transcription factor [Nocardia sp. NRRL WC-3656]|uniref:ArsR/SmtB family transcription factor n=1 Tax=Nocardia sp. NRRL WC-3656 TaxID=1463824 RepID=UPI001E4F2FB3|nr:metalloregulator ArsR/SmtB family transcription factor [Nocardia sp. NRRL WC-3656]